MMRKTWFKKIFIMIMAGVMTMSLFTGCGTTKTVTVDFSEKDGNSVQNLKKFDNFTPNWTWVNTYALENTAPENLIPALDAIKAESLRFDLFMGIGGSLGRDIGKDGGDGSTDEEMEKTMQLVNRLVENKILPYVCYFASPEYVTDGGWKSPPDEAKWEELCYNIATYFKNKGIRLAAHEVWNEPDYNGEFFSGDWADYIRTYIAGYKGIRRANADAVISGMSIAYSHDIFEKKATIDGKTQTGWQRFIEATYDDYLPDAISWHYYGRETDIINRDDPTENLDWYLQSVRNGLNSYQDGTNADIEGNKKYEKLQTVQQHLDEFNIFQPWMDDVYQTTGMLPGMFTAFKKLLSATDVTRVSWASLTGDAKDGLGYDLIDGLSLQRFPAYHALWMYSRLPVDRVDVDLENKNLETMAGVDSSRAGLIVYNTSDTTQKVNVKLSGIPFENGDVNVYLVDDNHYSYSSSNEPVMVRQRKNVKVNEESVRMELLPHSAYYIEVNDESGKSEVENYAEVGSIVRKDYWYPMRADNAPYSDMHENSFIAHVGMADNATGKSAIAVTVDDLLNKDSLTVNYETWGNLTKTDTSALGVKIEYQRADGTYSDSTFYTVSDFNYNLVTPFGSEKQADYIVSMGGENGKYVINLKDNAPADWTGRVILTYQIQDAGMGATAKFIVR